jgi:hypothetical protein
MKQLFLLLLNTLTFIYTLTLNGFSSSGALNGKTVGEVSDIYVTLFTPAGYAFSIWGLIYLLLIGFVIHQWYDWFKNRNDKELLQTGIWFAIGNIANGTWIYFWINEFIGISVILMLVLLVSLVAMTIRLRLELWGAPFRIAFFVWWPITIYLGWIVVATVANISAFLVSIEWNGAGISSQIWTIIMIAIAVIIYLLLLCRRYLREASMVGVWALIAIAVEQWQTETGIVTATLIGAGILFISATVQGIRNQSWKHLFPSKS